MTSILQRGQYEAAKESRQWFYNAKDRGTSEPSHSVSWFCIGGAL